MPLARVFFAEKPKGFIASAPYAQLCEIIVDSHKKNVLVNVAAMIRRIFRSFVIFGNIFLFLAVFSLSGYEYCLRPTLLVPIRTLKLQ